jgi:tetratricopeptide (TPR) repeat protein
MERSKYFIVFFLIMVTINLRASYKTDIYSSYITNNMTKWKAVIDDMNGQKNKDNDFIMELINYQYGYIAWCIGNDKNDLAEQYLTLAENQLALLEKKAYKLYLVNSYKAAFYGYRIGLNKLKAPFLGPKSINCAELSMKLDKNNPYGYIQYGNAQYHMPAVFGGSKVVALEYFNKAQSLMELSKDELKFDWNYLSLLTNIAMANSAIGNYNKAKAYYEKILKLEPNFLWVKNELYPELLKKIK